MTHILFASFLCQLFAQGTHIFLKGCIVKVGDPFRLFWNVGISNWRIEGDGDRFSGGSAELRLIWPHLKGSTRHEEEEKKKGCDYSHDKLALMFESKADDNE